MSALPKAEAARLRGLALGELPEADAEPEHQERSAMAKIAALREQQGRSAYPDAELKERLWIALDRSVDLLEEKLGASAGYDVTGEAEAVCNIIEAMDRLGLLKPPPVEAPEMSKRLHEPNEVADLRAKLKAAEAKIATADAMYRMLKRRVDAAERRAIRARQEVDILLKPANAEGIASTEGEQ